MACAVEIADRTPGSVLRCCAGPDRFVVPVCAASAGDSSSKQSQGCGVTERRRIVADSGAGLRDAVERRRRWATVLEELSRLRGISAACRWS